MVAKKRQLFPKPVFDEDLLTEAFQREGISIKHTHTIWRYLIQQSVTDWKEIPQIPKKAVALLEREFTLFTTKVLSRTDNSDKSTTKLLIELQDGQKIESVIMRYGDVALSSFPEEEKQKLYNEDGSLKFKSNKRATVCVSSQVGCAMGCTFCATGTMGLMSNLTAGEILEQLVHANAVEKIRNVVFMGMGEPLDNYQSVLTAVRGMVDTGRFGLSPSRISISTVGVVPRLQALAVDLPDIGLALSLHAPNQTLRSQIVPTAKAWHIDKIMAAMDHFIDNQNSRINSNNRKRHVLVEYVLIADVNDSEEVAHQLGALLKGRSVLLNVIPYNPTSVPYDYKPPLPAKTTKFVAIVRHEYGVRTLLRQELGQDIASACGQLVIDSAKSSLSSGCTKDGGVTDLEDLMAKNASKSSTAGLVRRKTGGATVAKSTEQSEFKISPAYITEPKITNGEMGSRSISMIFSFILFYAILFLLMRGLWRGIAYLTL